MEHSIDYDHECQQQKDEWHDALCCNFFALVLWHILGYSPTYSNRGRVEYNSDEYSVATDEYWSNAIGMTKPATIPPAIPTRARM